ncbi:MAG TPA: ABC transporter permease [Arenimonas sp.]|nr:ABC transporter permease [Arenimonas sp.]
MNDNGASQPPRVEPSAGDPGILRALGDWTLEHAQTMLDLIESAPDSAVDIDGRDIHRLDSAGVMLLSRYATAVGLGIATVEVSSKHQSLIDSLGHLCEVAPREVERPSGFRDMLARIGHWVDYYLHEVWLLLGFLGLTLQTLLGVLLRPQRIRLTATVHHMEQVGLDAVPLVMLLSAMIGAVIAFLGATVLRDFGAEIFVVELVAVAYLREFGVMLTAILLAGRTASAFTAQIGAMQSGEEVDAMRTLGLDPIELLVLPRLFALLLTLPLLTFLSMIAGILGGMAVTVLSLGLSAEMFFVRMQEMVWYGHLWVGLSKAPIFALVIAVIGCLEGFQVKGSAESVGERTTSSVVQTISWVILIDALAAMFFMEMDW